MKKFLFLLVALCNLYSYAQNSSYKNFGRISQFDFDITQFQEDSTANALVLYENAETRFKVKSNKVIIETAHYYKIKIFNKEGFKHALFEIPLYKNERSLEKVEEIQAFTHNGLIKTALKKEEIFKTTLNDHWEKVSFTLPNLKENSIIEVKYVVKSPFKFNLTGWQFQSDIPKLYSQYKASIPGNYIYSRKLIGALRLTKNESIIEKSCFEVPVGKSDCEVITYAMNNIPAFFEEDFMTNKDNFLAALKFELQELKWFDVSTQKYSKTWKNVDQEFRTDNDLGRQLKKTDFFKNKLPLELTTATSDLEKAKLTYSYIQDHFVYNDKFGLWKDIKLKKSFEERTANATAINLSLINALNAVGLDAKMMLVSTRQNGLATKEYPVISDFNYVIAKLDIGEKSYLLDATDKLAPFGLLPFRCLNSYGRVMDFENESYWYDIEPTHFSKEQWYIQLSLAANGQLKGNIRSVNYQYDALSRRKDILNLTEEAVIEKFEAQFPDLFVENYEVKNLHNIDKPITENFEVTFENDLNVDNLYLNPFYGSRFKTNPFTQKDRTYPVDFGYPRKYYINFTLELEDGYVLETVPSSKKLVLPEKTGSYSLQTRRKENYFVQLKSAFILSKPKYFRFEYHSLKELLNQVVTLQKTDIVIKKELTE